MGYVDETGGGSDAHQSGHSTGGSPDGGWLAILEPFNQAPSQQTGRSRGGGGEEGIASGLGGEHTGAVETKPAEPEQTRTQQDEGNVVGRTLAVRPGAAFADDRGSDKGRHTRGDVHHGATGEVNRSNATEGTEETTAPHHLGHRRVDQEAPDQAEPEPSLEAHPFNDGTRDQGRGDDREHALEEGEGGGAQVEAVGQGSIAEFAADSVHPHRSEATDEGALEAAVEGEAVADHHPEHPDEPHQEEAHHHRVEHVLRAGEAAVEEGQAWSHQQHQGRADQHQEGVGTVVDSFWKGGVGSSSHQRGQTCGDADHHECGAAQLRILDPRQEASAPTVKDSERCETTADQRDKSHERGRPQRSSPPSMVSGCRAGSHRYHLRK